MNELISLSYKLFCVSIFQNVLKNETISTLLSVFAQSENSLSEALIRYSKFVKMLYESEFQGDFGAYLKDLILYDENVFSCASANDEKLSEEISTAAKKEIEILNELFLVSTQKIQSVLVAKFQGCDEIVQNMPSFKNSGEKIDFEELKKFYAENGCGIFAKFSAFTFSKDLEFKPENAVDNIKLSDLKDYDAQKEKLVLNTSAFIQGKGANNVLLYGDRGCGKSSSVKAVFNEYKNQGLKIVQILKADLCVLNKLMAKLAKIPAKFIIFIDDLSFSEDNENLSTLKSTLEGGISAQSENTLIYATTNRRHIVKETFSTREGNEVHLADTMDENASLSDRFGITLTFLAPTKDKYIEIAKKIAQDKGIKISEDFEIKAERFAILKTSRSPRVAQQFVRSLG